MSKFVEIEPRIYYEKEGYVNYSLLKRISESGNKAFITSEKSALRSRKTFDAGHVFERYFLEDKDLSYIRVDKTDNLTPQGKKLFEYLLDYCKRNDISDAETIEDDKVIEITRELALWNNIKSKELLIERTLDSILKTNFYLTLTDDAIIGDMEIFDTVAKMDEGMKANEEVLRTLDPCSDDDIEIHNQLAIFNEDSFKLPVKGLLDRVIVNNTKKVITVIDFKSMDSPVEKFMTSFYQFKYYYQLPFYTTLLKTTYPEYKDYKFEMKFVVVSKKYPLIPAVYVLPNTWIDKVWNGWVNRGGYKVRGIDSLMEEVGFYWLGGTDKPYNLAINDNIMTIEDDWDK